MPATVIKHHHRTLREAEGQGALHKGSVRRAFEPLLRETAVNREAVSVP